MKLLRLTLAVLALALSTAACTRTLPTLPAAELSNEGTGFGGGGTR